ncbi:conserved oligomeric Golgi complex subunit 6 [Trichonephila clavipes]|nr:conserved oligomeric Golgi complex subunit 6 [Trichonephila clavipes]
MTKKSEALDGLYEDVVAMNECCNDMMGRLQATKSQTHDLINETTKLQAESQKIQMKQEVTQAFLDTFHLKPEEIKVLRGTRDGGLDKQFFEVLTKVKKIHNNCKALLRSSQQTAGSPVSAKSGSTSNLFGHLRLHHPLQFSEVSNKSKIVMATVQYSPFCAAVDESIDEPQPQSNMTVSESNQFNFVDNHMHKRQKFMTDFKRLDDQASKRTTDSVTKFLVCTMQPYNLVDRKEFINMVKVLNPRYSLLGRKHFTATAVPKLYNEVRDKIRELLHGLKSCIRNELEDEERSPLSPRVTTNGGKNTSLCLFNSMVEHFKISERFLENQPICKTLLEYSNKKHLMLEGNEISALEDFTTATELLEDITSSLSGEQYTTASAVLPLYMKIKNNQNKDEDSSLLKSIKSEILESLNKYESHPMSSNLQLSTLCDPRFRQKASNPDNFENIETRTKEQNKKGLAKFFDVFGSNSNSENTRNPSQEAEKELNEYLSMPRVSFEHDPLDWWKVHYESFPSLKVLARKYLCIQGSRSPERINLFHIEVYGESMIG